MRNATIKAYFAGVTVRVNRTYVTVNDLMDEGDFFEYEAMNIQIYASYKKKNLCIYRRLLTVTFAMDSFVKYEK